MLYFGCVIVSIEVIFIILTRYVYPIPYFSPFYNAQIHFCVFVMLVLSLSILIKRSWLPLILGLVSIALATAPIFSNKKFELNVSGNGGHYFRSIKVMTFNVLAENIDGADNIAEAINASGADIAIINEAHPLRNSISRFASHFPYRVGCEEVGPSCDMMIISKLQIKERMAGRLSRAGGQYMRIGVNFGDAELKVFGVHVTKPYYDAYSRIELAELTRVIKEVSGPILVAGDFNASSISPDIAGFLTASDLLKASNEPATWPTWLGNLGISIDHIYVRSPLRIASVKRLKNNYGSNHFGIIAETYID